MIEKQITVHSDGVRLAGTLCLPSEEGTFPCVLMIHGSGPVDRDENTRQMKFIKVNLNAFNTTAHYLAEKGIASLRYDKRGCGKSSGDYGKAGFHDLIRDAKAIYQYLSSQEYVKKDSLFLLGHSEGTVIAPKIAAEYPEIAGLILLAPFAQNMEQPLRYQVKKLKEDAEQGGGLNRLIMRLAWKLTGDPAKVQSVLFEKIRSTTKDSFRYKGQRINAKWLREHLDDNPAETMRNISCPILALAGEKDIQVDPQDAVRIAELAKGDVEYHIVPNLTHILRLDYEPPSILNYKKLLKKDMDHSILELIGDWLERRLQNERTSS